MHIESNKLAIKTDTKTFHFDLPKNVDSSLMLEINFIIEHGEMLGKNTINMRLPDCFWNVSMETILMYF